MRTSRSIIRSLRQPRFSQSLFVSREVFRPAKRNHMPEIGNPQRRIDLAEARHGLVRLIEPPGKRMACCSHARRGSRICLLQESLLRPRRRLVIATSVEMTGANYGKCERRERIEWAEADGAPCPFDCDLGLAQTNVDPTA